MLKYYMDINPNYQAHKVPRKGEDNESSDQYSGSYNFAELRY